MHSFDKRDSLAEILQRDIDRIFEEQSDKCTIYRVLTGSKDLIVSRSHHQ